MLRQTVGIALTSLQVIGYYLFAGIFFGCFAGVLAFLVTDAYIRPIVGLGMTFSIIAMAIAAILTGLTVPFALWRKWI